MKGDSRSLLQKGTLWGKIVTKTEESLKTGAQLPIPTAYEFIEDAGIRFFVRILSSLQQKDEDRRKLQETSSSGKTTNPFLPYEKALYVADISDTHVALLNKFNVVENHLLIITRRFEDQETLLTLRDFEALWVCMAEYNALGFYNGGAEAGASQPHKHLQMAPLPLAPEGPGIPIEPLLKGAGAKESPGNIPGLPFLHGFIRFKHNGIDSPIDAAQHSFVLYGNLLSHVGLRSHKAEGNKRQSSPYCLLITREWMLLVPRSQEFFNSISINSLGFAGALLVRNSDQMDILKKLGPMTALKSVALPS
jgi:sulfate adenylyltransferase (ADP) / ATP adenylyltransferase